MRKVNHCYVLGHECRVDDVADCDMKDMDFLVLTEEEETAMLLEFSDKVRCGVCDNIVSKVQANLYIFQERSGITRGRYSCSKCGDKIKEVMKGKCLTIL